MKNKNIHKLFSILLSTICCVILGVFHSFSNTNNDSITKANCQQACEDSDFTANYQKLESTLFTLYKLGYRQIPAEMQKILLARNQGTPPFSPGEKGPGDEGFLSYLSLSNNTFPEIIQTNDLVAIGNTTLDIKSHKICNINTTNNTNVTDPTTFALSLDPFATKFPDKSPYNAMGNNPINRIDPTGMADEPAGNFDQLQTETTLPVSLPSSYVQTIVNSRDIVESVYVVANASKQNNTEYIINKYSLRPLMSSTNQATIATQLQKFVPQTEFEKLASLPLKVEGSSLTLKTYKADDMLVIPLQNAGGAQLHIADGAAVDFSHLTYTYTPQGTCDSYTGLRDMNGTIYMKGVSIQASVLGKQFSYEVKKINVTTTIDADGNNITQFSLTGPAAIFNSLLQPSIQNKYQCKQ